MLCRGAKSFADDLGLIRGVVLSRAAASLQSIETKPFDWKICPHRTDTLAEYGRAACKALREGSSVHSLRVDGALP